MNLPGLSLFCLNRYEEAIDCYDRALRLDSSDLDLLHSKALALSSLKRYKEAIDSYDKILIVDPNNKQAQMDKSKIIRFIRK